MRTHSLLAAASLLALLSVPGPASAQDMPSAGECWRTAMLANDADAVAQCYADDAVMWFPGGPMAQGRDAIREGYAGYLGAYEIRSAQLQETGAVEGEDAHAGWGTFEIVMVEKATGKEIHEVGRFSDASRVIDGRWVYVMDHASDDPPPAGADAPAH